MHPMPHRWILAALLFTLGLMTGAPVAAMPILPPDAPRIYLPLVIRQAVPQPPLYRLIVAEDDLEWLYDPANRWTYETVPGVFLYDGIAYEVEVRFRGGTVRYLSKKSWKIDFPAATPFPWHTPQRELNLNAEYTDKSYLREHLAYSVFHAAGFPAARTRYVRLEVNGEYMGLFLQVEQIDPRFLHRVGWDPNGNLYKGDYGGNFNWGGVEYEEAYVKKTNKEDSHRDLIDLLWRINLTPDEEFAAALAEEMDVGRYLDWYAVQIALGNYEWLEKNYYLYHQLAADWWAFAPWDLDLTLGHNWGMNGILDEDSTWDNPIDSGTVDSPKADGKYNKLITRVLDDEALRFAYCRRLRALLHGPFTEAALYPQIDATYHYIRAAAEADPHKWGTNEEFQAGPAELKTYIAQRRIWLLAEMPDYCPESGPMSVFPVINEVQWPRPISATDALSVTPWIELYNPAVVSFDVGGMRLRAPATGTLFLDWPIPPETVIPPGGFLRIWAAGLGAGDAVTLVDAPLYGDAVIDRVAPLSPTLSALWGRRPDGAEDWITMTRATPGGSNLGRAPTITATSRTPEAPQAGQPVTVTAHISDVDALRWDEILTPTLHWRAEGRAHQTPLHDDGQHGDGAPNDHIYGATLPGLDAGEVITYYIQVIDAAGLIGAAPARAPENAYAYIVGFERPPIRINELVAINRNAGEDEHGESADWFELYNSGDVSVTLGGMYLTDALENTTKWQIPAGIVAPPHGHVLFWADGEPDEGPTHTNFKLDGDSGRLALYAGASGYSDRYHALIDEVFYGPQTVDQAWGRFPDGAAHWRRLAPTPGARNVQSPPEITAIRHEPRAPSATAPTRVRAHITGDTAILSATLYWSYDQSAGWQATPMRHVSASEYAAAIPAPPGGTLALSTTVAYTITARDEAGRETRAPNGAPEIAFGYQIGAAPPIVLNELMAANDQTVADERGGYDDWFELYNRSAITVELSEYYLSDTLNRAPKWRMPSGTRLAPGEHLLIWADDAPGEGPLHAPFKLSRDGETLVLFTTCGAGRYCAIDWITFNRQATDIPLARLPDGDPAWQATFDPTPGGPNPTP
ncbi:MAG: CotH kinase family protein [Anaerolineales bacterium]